MKSRITIERDFDNGEAFIKVDYIEGSTDMRDQAVKKLISQLGYTSSLFRSEITCSGQGNMILKLTPIKPDDLLTAAQEIFDQNKINGAIN